MEEVLVVILGAVLEVLLEILAYLPCDAFFSGLERRRTGPGSSFETPLTGVVLMGTAIGLILGGISLAIRLQTMLPWAGLRIANLLAAPFLSGMLARKSALRRAARGQPSSPRNHFWFAFALTMAIVTVRFAFATRPM